MQLTPQKLSAGRLLFFFSGDDSVGRDVFNEKPSADDLALLQAAAKGPLPRSACINTSYGEVRPPVVVVLV